MAENNIAPEMIWVEKSIAERGTHGSTAWPNSDDDSDIEYVRADLLDRAVEEAVAAVIKEVADEANTKGYLCYFDVINLDSVDAPAILARIRAEAKAEGMREAAEICDGSNLYDPYDCMRAILAAAAAIEKTPPE